MDKYFVITFPGPGKHKGSIEYHNPNVPVQKIMCTDETFFIFHRITKILCEDYDAKNISDIITKKGRVITVEDIS